jgi:hypothetical protein
LKIGSFNFFELELRHSFRKEIIRNSNFQQFSTEMMKLLQQLQVPRSLSARSFPRWELPYGQNVDIQEYLEDQSGLKHPIL